MGLDMYLHAKKYVSGWNFERDNEEKVAVGKAVNRTIVESVKKRVREEPEVRRAKARKAKETKPSAEGSDEPPKGGGTVPQVPLKG